VTTDGYTDSNLGCDGGIGNLAYAWLKTNPDVLESNYPYKGKRTTCNHKAKKTNIKPTGHVTIRSDAQMMAQLQKGPIHLGIDGSSPAVQNYESGIITNAKACKVKGNGGPDHDVTFGYGTASGIPYWIIKNSWTADYGEHGFFRVVRGKGICGINNDNYAPIV